MLELLIMLEHQNLTLTFTCITAVRAEIGIAQAVGLDRPTELLEKVDRVGAADFIAESGGLVE